MKEKLETLLRTLNVIEVHGTGNLNHLLGCIQLVRSLINEADPEIGKTPQGE